MSTKKMKYSYRSNKYILCWSPLLWRCEIWSTLIQVKASFLAISSDYFQLLSLLFSKSNAGILIVFCQIIWLSYRLGLKVATIKGQQLTWCYTCLNVPESGRNRTIFVSIEPIPAWFWHIQLWHQDIKTLNYLNNQTQNICSLYG